MAFRIPFPRSIRARLVALVLGVALPLVALIAFDYSNRLATRVEHAGESARVLAGTVAASLTQLIESERAMLAALAARPAQRVERPAVCDPLIAEILTLNPYRANITVTAASGEPVCSAVPLSVARPVSVADQEYAQRILRTGEFTIGEPFKGRITGRWVVPLVFPRRDAAERMIGWVGAPLDTERIGELLARSSTDQGDVVTVVSPQGKIIARSTDAAKWVGSDVRSQPFAPQILAGTVSTWRSAGLDGTARIRSAVDVPGTGWKVVVGLDEAKVLAPANAALARNSLLIAVILLLVAVLALGIGRAIAAPIHALTRTVRRIAHGERGLRAPLTGATEIDRIALELNRMLDALDRSGADNERATAALREREETLRLVTETIDEVFWMADVEISTMIYISPSYERVWGRTLASLIENPRSFLDAVHPDDLDRLLAALESERGGELYECEYRVIRPDATERCIWDRGYPIRDESGKATRYAGVAQDITERKQAEELLRERDSQLQTIVENITEGLAVSDLDGQLLHFNRAALDLHGFTTLDECRQHLTRFADTFELSAMDGTVWPVAQWPLARILGGESLRDLEVGIRHLHAGWQKVFNYGGTLVCDGDGRPLMAIVTISDITERKRAEAALAESRARLLALTRRLLEVQESERRSIARELHDEVGGALTAVKLNLQALRRAHTAEQGEAALADGLALVDGAIQSVRSLSLDLRPAVLDDLGLIPALKWYAESQARRSGVAIELALDAIDLKAAPQLESACFRIVQEAVTNALRHSAARRIQVALRREDGHFTIEIADDGAGFDPAAARKRGLAGENGGLLGMEERAELLGGRFGIDSAPGAGARVWAEFAMPEEGVT